MAENLHQLGIHVSIWRNDWPSDGTDWFLHGIARTSGINHERSWDLYLGKGVESFEENNRQLQVCVKGGEKIDADLVIIHRCTRTNQAAQDAGLTIGEMQGIYVNDYYKHPMKIFMPWCDRIQTSNYGKTVAQLFG